MANLGEGTDVSDTLAFSKKDMLTLSTRFDGKGIFRDGFSTIRSKLEKRFYTSVSTFSADFSAVFSSAIGSVLLGPLDDMQTQLPGPALAKDLSNEQKDKRKLAKRIVKAVQSALEDATRKESELCRKPFEKELKELDLLLENSVLSRRDSVAGSLGEVISDEDDGQVHTCINGSGSAMEVTDTERPNDRSVAEILEGEQKAQLYAPPLQVPEPALGFRNGEVAQQTAQDEIDGRLEDANSALSQGPNGGQIGTSGKDPAPFVNGHSNKHEDPEANDTGPVVQPGIVHHVPPTPPLSSEGDPSAPFSYGGIPWYMDPFDPIGTTIHEERWTGRDVVRSMSEELSDMDDEELQGLVDEEMADAGQEGDDGIIDATAADKGTPPRRKGGGKRRRWRGFR